MKSFKLERQGKDGVARSVGKIPLQRLGLLGVLIGGLVAWVYKRFKNS